MRILIVTTQVPFCFGGAELHAQGLREALLSQGHEAEIASIPFKWDPPEQILDHLLACRLLNLNDSHGVPIDRVIGLKFPAYHVKHPNKVLWILHQHRSAFDFWENSDCDLATYPNGRQVRDAIHHLECNLLTEARLIYANSENVANRLQKYCRITAPPLYHPPPFAETFFCELAQDYLFYPSRLNSMKRQDLVIRALAKTSESVQVRFAGAQNEPAYFEKLKTLAKKLKVARRISWLGDISHDEKLQQYAHARAVIYPPIDEDYGYVTLEAMLSSKPVLTCNDSGGPLEFVDDGITGLIAEPTAESFAKALDRIWSDKGFAQKAGESGREKYNGLGISWKKVVEALLK